MPLGSEDPAPKAGPADIPALAGREELRGLGIQITPLDNDGFNETEQIHGGGQVSPKLASPSKNVRFDFVKHGSKLSKSTLNNQRPVKRPRVGHGRSSWSRQNSEQAENKQHAANNTNIAESSPQIDSPHRGPQLPLVSHVAPRTAGERTRPKMYMTNEQDGLGLNNRDIVKLGAFLESRNQNHPILISGGVPSQQLQAHYARN